MLVGSSKILEAEDDEETLPPVIERDFGADEIFDGTQFPVPELDADSDDDVAWEEVDEPKDGPPLKKDAPLEVIIEKASRVNQLKKQAGVSQSNRRAPPTPAERAARQDLHKAHVLCFLAHGKHRNSLINDEVLQARLMSKTPLPLQDAFYSFSRQTHPNERDRSRLFDLAMKRLISWWWSEYDIDANIQGIRTRAYGDVAKELVREGVFGLEDMLALLKDEGARDQDIAGPKPFGQQEVIKSAQSLMKRCVQMKGSRDVSAQLFTSLCRALGIPSRLVFSLQPIDWHATVAASGSTTPRAKKGKKADASDSPKSKGKARASTTEEEDSEDFADFEEVVTGSSSKPISVASETESRPSRASSRPVSINTTEDESDISTTSKPMPAVRLRKSKPPKSARSPSPDAFMMSVQPVFWTEVYSRSNKEWIPIDATRKAFRSRGLMEPPKANPQNKMLYVVAFEEDGYIRDVTPRYVKQFGAVTVKNRVSSRSKGEDWWESVLRPLKRPYTLERDSREDAELLKSQITETMPTAVGGFKDHPLYVLQRHLKREEVILPRRKLGLFRSEEVFPRSSVITCRSAEQWMREGRKVKAGEQPLKLVKQRAVTLGKIRAQEAAMADGEEPVQQGLYAKFQTELVTPEAVVNGKVPRNAFGNIDLYAEHMVPEGGTHLPYKGIAKIAKQLKVDFAEAITGFEFHKRRAIPVATGIVVPSESADVVLEAFEAFERAAAEKALAKKQERVMKRWKTLFKGLLLRERLQAEYKSATASPAPSVNGRNELADLEVSKAEVEIEVDREAKHSAPSAPAKLSNTLRSLEKGHAGRSQRRTLPNGTGRAAELSDDGMDEHSEVESEVEVLPSAKVKRAPPKRKQTDVPIDSTEEDVLARPSRRSKRHAKAEEGLDGGDGIATTRPRRAAAKSVSYKHDGGGMPSEDEG